MTVTMCSSMLTEGTRSKIDKLSTMIAHDDISLVLLIMYIELDKFQFDECQKMDNVRKLT